MAKPKPPSTFQNRLQVLFKIFNILIKYRSDFRILKHFKSVLTIWFKTVLHNSMYSYMIVFVYCMLNPFTQQVYRAAKGNPFSEHDMRQSREYLDLIFEHVCSGPLQAFPNQIFIVRIINLNTIKYYTGTRAITSFQYPKSRSESAHVKKRSCTYDFTRWDRVPGDSDYYRPTVTSYNNAFRWYHYQRPPQAPVAETPLEPMRISRRPFSAYESGSGTTYHYDFCGGSPEGGTLDAMGNRKLLSVKQMQLQPRHTVPVPAPPPGEPRQRARSAKPDESVARCLVWPEPPGPNRLLQRPFSAHPNLLSSTASASLLPDAAPSLPFEPISAPPAAAPPPMSNPE